ncbi:hypothetical protein ABZ419_12150 [Streptomyces cinnamoneus]|uniref:hypothetical protein n=1 Tax=Streptomyces cinnamoneus TaxID=53446 RepID=UPI0033E1AF1F
MIRRLMARHRLAVRYWSGWVSSGPRGRQIGPRPILALHRTPDPNCPDCDGRGEVMSGSPGQDEPDWDDCHCAPFLPLAYLWLPKPPAWLRRRRPAHDPWCTNPACTHDEPPF